MFTPRQMLSLLAAGLIPLASLLQTPEVDTNQKSEKAPYSDSGSTLIEEPYANLNTPLQV